MNELKLHEKFIGKEYGIMGDSGFTFNKKGEKERIHRKKPSKKPQNRLLTNAQKSCNTNLPEV